MNFVLINQFLKSLMVIVCMTFLLSTCATDELPRPEGPRECEDIVTSYELNIRQIIDNGCAYSGCHPEYSTYDGLLPVLEDGTFRSRVITLRDDPVLGMPTDDVPQDRPADLSEEELTLIECWLGGDYPEN